MAKFEYGVASIKDLRVKTEADGTGRALIRAITLKDRPLRPTTRFWNSLHLRFGFTSNIFRYFSHAEVFQRISEKAPNDRFRYCIESDDGGTTGNLLAVSGPGSAVMRRDDLLKLLDKHAVKEEGVSYHNGVVRSQHAPRLGGTFQVAGDGFQNRFVIETPIDGFGRASVYLSLLRLVCSNGAIGYTPAFRSELSVGKGEDGVAFALERVLEGFNNEDGFAAMRQRFDAAARSWASVNEANKLYKLLAKLHNAGQVYVTTPLTVKGGDGASTLEPHATLFHAFHKMTGDLSQIYGLANLDALSVKRQRTLPAACKVYDLLNFASEVATHHTSEQGNRSLSAYLGDLIASEYDLEGTVDHLTDWRDFFISHDATTETLASMTRRS
jgi:hypothetical protein